MNEESMLSGAQQCFIDAVGNTGASVEMITRS
jgi:hypothetical protein